MMEMLLDDFEAETQKFRKKLMASGGYPPKRTQPHRNPGKTRLLIAFNVAQIKKHPGIVRDADGEWSIAP